MYVTTNTPLSQTIISDFSYTSPASDGYDQLKYVCFLSGRRNRVCLLWFLFFIWSPRISQGLCPRYSRAFFQWTYSYQRLPSFGVLGFGRVITVRFAQPKSSPVNTEYKKCMVWKWPEIGTRYLWNRACQGHERKSRNVTIKIKNL